MSDAVRHDVGEFDREDISTWREELEGSITRWFRPDPKPLDRVIVLAETESTQDSAVRLCDAKPGLMVIAARQTKGRGRLGRSWADTSGLGVAATFVLDGARFDDAHLSLAAGYAACIASSNECGDGHNARFRWPNDAVEPDPPHRKIAGVLVERTNGLAFVGIGVNVLQGDSDWPEELREKAVSLRQLRHRCTRIAVARSLVWHLYSALADTTESLAAHWRLHDILVGTHRAFIHNNHQHFGLVLDIDPANAIRLRLPNGTEVSLPARTTSLVHE